MKKKIFSGVQPTGNLHLGNYLGAIKNFVELDNDNENECVFCVVDLHAITVNQDPKELKNNILETVATFVASGIQPKKSIIFNQSQVSAHSEAAWVLSCTARMGWLNRMTQFKEKAGKDKERASVGLYSYPVLMAADILLYDTTHVPVGEDQKQHLELARDIAQQRVNARFNNGSSEILKTPKALIIKEGAKIMSLTDARNKMSKSDPNEGSRIALLDPPELIAKKIKRAKTDAFLGLEFENPNRPEASNLLTIYSILKGINKNEALEECSDIGWGKFKPLLTEVVISALEPIQIKYNELINSPDELSSVLSQGKIRANEVAMETLRRVKNAIGFLN